MSWLEDILFPGHFLSRKVEQQREAMELIGGVGEPDQSIARANAWLFGLAAVGVGICAAPSIYRAYNASSRGKRHTKGVEIAQGLDDAATRAVTLASAFLPAAGLPIAYITVQALEAKGIISSGLGNAVQGLITAGAVAPAIGGVLNFAAKAVK